MKREYCNETLLTIMEVMDVAKVPYDLYERLHVAQGMLLKEKRLLDRRAKTVVKATKHLRVKEVI